MAHDEKHTIPGPSQEMKDTEDMSPAQSIQLTQDKGIESEDDTNSCSDLSDSNEDFIPGPSYSQETNHLHTSSCSNLSDSYEDSLPGPSYRQKTNNPYPYSYSNLSDSYKDYLPGPSCSYSNYKEDYLPGPSCSYSNYKEDYLPGPSYRQKTNNPYTSSCSNLSDSFKDSLPGPSYRQKTNNPYTSSCSNLSDSFKDSLPGPSYSQKTNSPYPYGYSNLSDYNEDYLPGPSYRQKINNPYRYLHMYIRNRRSNVPTQGSYAILLKRSETRTDLMKPCTAVTGVLNQGHTLVKESEAHTEIGEPSSSNQEELAVTTQSDSSTTETIGLKVSKGETDVKKE